VLKLSTLETGLGAVALAAATSGAFLIAGGAPQQLLMFFCMVSAALLIAATIVVLRINQHDASIRAQISALLPGELRHFGDAQGIQSLDTEGLFAMLEAFQLEQQELLNANCLALIHGTQALPELAQAEDELCQLRAELAALEDQFRSEQLFNSLGTEGGFGNTAANDSNSHFYHLGGYDPQQFRSPPE